MLNNIDLKLLTDDPKLAEVFSCIVGACMRFYDAIDTNLGYAETENESGDTQIKLDVLADSILTNCFRDSKLFKAVASEEKTDVDLLNQDADYIVCYDPVDGSSIVDANLAFGSVFGVYQADSFIGQKASNLKMAVCVTYGPRIQIFAACEKGVVEIKGTHKNLLITDSNVILDCKKPIMAFGNLKLMLDQTKPYASFVHELIENKVSLRYSGSLVVEVSHILSKRAGVFSFLVIDSKPKLRLLYECGPLAYLIEKAGGASSNLETSILNVEVSQLHQNVNFYVSDKEIYNKFKLINE